MDVKIELWTIEQLFSIRDEINEQPRYQRGAVWSDLKKSLLIDSILRGIDLPKIYLNKKKKGSYTYEVADGQQRLNAILKFKENNLRLRSDKILGLDLNKISNYVIGDKTYSELNTNLQNRLDNYLLTIAIVENSSNEEIRTLFGRLQLGDPLKPAEKRNAIISSVGNDIDTIATNHEFFKKTRIKKERFNHQDYLAHAFTLIAYNNQSDLKAELIQKMYLDETIAWSMGTLKSVDKVLDFLVKIDAASKKRIEKKFSFLDIFWFLFQNIKSIKSIDFEGFAKHYDKFETERKANHKEPEKLLLGKNKNKNLYDYIMAFKFEGLRSVSYDLRLNIIKSEFNQFISK